MDAKLIRAADSPIEALRAGNARFLDSIAVAADPEAARRALAVADPYAVILGCADARVAPESVFDESVGRLFVVRVAAHLAGNEEIGTIEYAVSRWNCPLAVVLGHTQCAAIAAAMDPPPPGAETPPSVAGATQLSMLLGSIRSNLGAPRGESSNDRWAEAVRANVRRTIEQLMLRSMPLRRRVEAGQLAIVGAVYDVETGEVEFLGPGAA
jgi:carbonic anhydrase